VEASVTVHIVRYSLITPMLKDGIENESVALHLSIAHDEIPR